MKESKIIEKIVSTFDKRKDDNFKTRRAFKGDVKNETILFLIKKGIVKKNRLQHYGFSREYHYGYKKNKTPIICCDYSKVKFVNESIKNDLTKIYKNINLFKFFQAKNKDLNDILNRDLNFLHDNNRRKKLINNFVKNKFWVDFACGYGGMLFKLNKICKRCVGIEVMSSAVEILKRKNFEIYPNIDVIENNSVDVITIFQSLELLNDHMKFLKLLCKKLKKGGKLIIETGNTNKALHELYKNEGYKKFTTLYRRVIYSEKAIKCLLNETGFDNIDIRHQQRYSFSNHLGWLVYNNTGNEISMFDDNQLNKIYSNILIKNKLSDTLFIICNKK